MMHGEVPPAKYKIVLVGCGGVGKTALVSALVGRPFEPKYIRMSLSYILPLSLLLTSYLFVTHIAFVFF